MYSVCAACLVCAYGGQFTVRIQYVKSILQNLSSVDSSPLRRPLDGGRCVVGVESGDGPLRCAGIVGRRTGREQIIDHTRQIE
jgi:hypothetical protein